MSRRIYTNLVKVEKLEPPNTDELIRGIDGNEIVLRKVSVI